eukprot:839312_1
MAYNLRKRAEKNVKRVSRVIYDDPTLVPTRKMSFTVSQWKKVSETGEAIQEFGKWTSNIMGYGYLQDDTLWIEFRINGTNMIIPKRWDEVATSATIHNEMLAYHEKYKYNVQLWMW